MSTEAQWGEGCGGGGVRGGRLILRPSLRFVSLPAGYAARLDGGELAHKVRPLSQEHQVLPGPDGAALRLVPDLCERPPPPGSDPAPTARWERSAL